MRYIKTIFDLKFDWACIFYKSLQCLQFAIFYLLIFVPVIGVYGQVPTNVPSPEAEPVDFFDSWQSVVLYVLVPLIIIILYFVWRHRIKKQAKSKK